MLKKYLTKIKKFDIINLSKWKRRNKE